MHKMFPDWLRTLSPDESLAELPVKQWWAAVDSMVDDATPTDVVDLARAACGRSSADFDTKWRGHLREHHDLSPLRGQDRQVAVLAGAALICVSENGPHRGLGLYARRCVTHASWEPELGDVVLGDDGIASVGADERVLAEWPVLRKASVTAATYAEHIPPAGTPVTGDMLQAALDSFAAGVADATQRSLRQVTRVASQREDRLMEQADVLTWLLSGRCGLLDCGWEDVSDVGAATMAAAAVLENTYFTIGRPDLVSLIGQAVDAALSSDVARDNRDHLREVLDAHGFVSGGPLADLQTTCETVYAGDTVNGSAIDTGVKFHDELFLQREFDAGAPS